ncbi:cation:dicarboxylate symporter family transporter [Pseudomonas canadensis]|uniref:cation:dicarboxylate symporter family transporter n=1 Tax=Pseudomonas canadensis TaxID=915099 RepID=UPI003B9DEBB1
MGSWTVQPATSSAGSSAGYCFNLDGSCINMTVLAIFIAQALDLDVSLYHQVTLLLILLLTSKGAASVTGGAFITLAATLGSIDVIPAAGVGAGVGRLPIYLGRRRADQRDRQRRCHAVYCTLGWGVGSRAAQA